MSHLLAKNTQVSSQGCRRRDSLIRKTLSMADKETWMKILDNGVLGGEVVRDTSKADIKIHFGQDHVGRSV